LLELIGILVKNERYRILVKSTRLNPPFSKVRDSLAIALHRRNWKRSMPKFVSPAAAMIRGIHRMRLNLLLLNSSLKQHSVDLTKNPIDLFRNLDRSSSIRILVNSTKHFSMRECKKFLFIILRLIMQTKKRNLIRLTFYKI